MAILRAAPNGSSKKNMQTIYGPRKGRQPPGRSLAIKGRGGSRFKGGRY